MANPLRRVQAVLLLVLALNLAGCTGRASKGPGGNPAGGAAAVPDVPGTTQGPPSTVPAGWRTLSRQEGDTHCQAAVPADWNPIVAHAAMIRQETYAEVFPVTNPIPHAFETWAQEQGADEITEIDTAGDPMVVRFRVASSIPDNTSPGVTVVAWRKVGNGGCGLKVALTDDSAARLEADLPRIIQSLGRG